MLTLEQVSLLRFSGFTEAEVAKLNEDLVSKPQPVDLDSIHWKPVLDRRREYMEKKVPEVARKNRCTMSAARAAVERYINEAYERIAGLTPWVLFRAEYAMSRAYKPLSDYRKAIRSRQKAEIKTGQLYGGAT